MGRLYSHLRLLPLFLLISFLSAYAFAQDVVAPQDFLSQVMQAIQGFGGLSWMLKVAAVITLLISSMKVSFLNQMIWSKLGSFQSWIAPILGLLSGLLTLAAGGNVTVAGVFAWLSAGAGAIILHELLDSVKAIPGLGPAYLAVINVIEGALGGAKA